MKHAVYDYETNKIIAIAQDADMAHSFAEVLSYKRNGNAVYGLFKMGIRDFDEMLSTEDGRKAWNQWHSER
jgi:hypothetical protein